MKRLMMFLLAVVSIVPAFSVRAQELRDAKVTIERPWPRSLSFEVTGKNVTVTSIAKNASGHLFTGTTDSAIYRSVDRGTTWSQLITPEKRVYELSLCSSQKLYAGFHTQGVAVSSDNGDTWTRLPNGLPSDAWVGDILVFGDTLYANAYGDDLFRSYNGGATWEGLHTPTPYISGVVKEKNGNLFVAAMGQGVLFSSDSGKTWVYKNNGFPATRKVSEIVTFDGTLYTGDDYAGTGIHRSTNGGESWERVGERVLPRYVGDLTANQDGNLYAGFSPGGVYRSSDRGTTWEYCGLSNYSVWSIFVADSDEVYVGTSDGLWLLKFSGTTGVEQIGDASQVTSYQLYQNYPNPFNPTTTIQFTIPERAFITVTVVNVLGQEVATLAAEEVAAGTHKTTWDATNLPSGIYFARLEAKNFVATKKMVLMK